MRNPNEFRDKILKNPWFLWLLIFLGINPVKVVQPFADTAAMQILQATSK